MKLWFFNFVQQLWYCLTFADGNKCGKRWCQLAQISSALYGTKIQWKEISVNLTISTIY